MRVKDAAGWSDPRKAGENEILICQEVHDLKLKEKKLKIGLVL